MSIFSWLCDPASEKELRALYAELSRLREMWKTPPSPTPWVRIPYDLKRCAMAPVKWGSVPLTMDEYEYVWAHRVKRCEYCAHLLLLTTGGKCNVCTCERCGETP
jgi:hypothetical protein